MNCWDCINYKVYRGSRDRYGVPQEPDEYECTGEPREEDIDKYFCNAEDGAEECAAFEYRRREEWD